MGSQSILGETRKRLAICLFGLLVSIILNDLIDVDVEWNKSMSTGGLSGQRVSGSKLQMTNHLLMRSTGTLVKVNFE